MIDEAKSLLDKLNSPSDWSIVLGAATIGGVLDGAINIIPVPFFSPGICALTAASAAFTVKRGVEAVWERRAARRRYGLLRIEGSRCVDALRRKGDDASADDLQWDIDLNSDDPDALRTVIQSARRLVRESQYGEGGAGITPMLVGRGGFGTTGRALNLGERE